jgi:acyl carrier protein
VSRPEELRPSDLTELLARYRGATAESAGPTDERIDSLELAWLLHQVEQRYGVELDLDDEQLARMSTVDNATEVFAEAVASGRSARGR